MVEGLWDKWNDFKIDQLDDEYKNINLQRETLYKLIAKAESDDERKVLSILLYKLDGGKL